MTQLHISNVDSNLYEQLQIRALGHGRTPEDEAKAILEQTLQNGIRSEVTQIYDRLKSSGKTFSDSTELLREDRDR
jgi:antitoxin FitA